MKRTATFLLLILASLSACGGGENEGEDYGNLLDSPLGLILTEEEHTGGWGRSQCTLCHNLENIHLENRTGLPLDIDEVHEIALEGGIEVCADCHGTNGVTSP